MVDAGVPSQHADVLGPKQGAQVKKLLADQRLDRARIDEALTTAHRAKTHRDRHQGLARTRWGLEHHMVPGDQFQDRFLLGWIGVDASLGQVAEKGVENRIRIRPVTPVRGGCTPVHAGNPLHQDGTVGWVGHGRKAYTIIPDCTSSRRPPQRIGLPCYSGQRAAPRPHARHACARDRGRTDRWTDKRVQTRTGRADARRARTNTDGDTVGLPDGSPGT